MKRIFFTVIISLCLVFGFSHVSFAKTKKKTSQKPSELFTAQSIIIVDISNDTILYSRNIHKQHAPASTVKLLTALVALDSLGDQAQVAISKMLPIPSRQKYGCILVRCITRLI